MVADGEVACWPLFADEGDVVLPATMVMQLPEALRFAEVVEVGE